MKKIFIILLLLAGRLIAQEAYSVEPSKVEDKQEVLLSLIEKLDARTCDEREKADKDLSKKADKSDIPFLAKKLRKTKGEQRLRLTSILIKLGWISKKNKKKLAKFFEELKNKDAVKRKQAVIDILRISNGEKYLQEKISKLTPGKLKLSMKLSKKKVKVNESIRIIVTLENVDKKGFFININQFSGSLAVKIKSNKKEYKISAESERGLWWARGNMINDIEKFQWVKPKEKLTLEQTYKNTFDSGEVKINIEYTNDLQRFQIVKYNISGSVEYSETFKMPAWKGTITASATYKAGK